MRFFPSEIMTKTAKTTQHDLMTMAEVAKRLRLPPDSRRRKAVHSALRKLGIEPIEIATNDFRVRRVDLDEALNGARAARQEPSDG